MTAGAPAAGLGEALTGLDRASIAAVARAVLHAGGHRAPRSPCRRKSRLTFGERGER